MSVIQYCICKLYKFITDNLNLYPYGISQDFKKCNENSNIINLRTINQCKGIIQVQYTVVCQIWSISRCTLIAIINATNSDAMKLNLSSLDTN